MAHVPAAERRNDFIVAAAQVIADHGVDGATTRRIASQAGAPLASLHYCFSSKEELLEAVYELLVDNIKQRITSQGRRTTSLAREAGRMFEGIANWYWEDRALSGAAIELLFWTRRRDAELGAKVYDDVFSIMAEGLVTEATSAQERRIVGAVARLLASMIDGYLLQWVAYEDDAQHRRDIKFAVRFIEASVGELTGS